MRGRKQEHYRTKSTRKLPFSGAFGAGNQTRTDDLLITNQLLYRLSYSSMDWFCLIQASSQTRMILYHNIPGTSTYNSVPPSFRPSGQYWYYNPYFCMSSCKITFVILSIFFPNPAISSNFIQPLSFFPEPLSRDLAVFDGSQPPPFPVIYLHNTFYIFPLQRVIHIVHRVFHTDFSCITLAFPPFLRSFPQLTL